MDERNNPPDIHQVVQTLPVPFNEEEFHEYRRGIYDHPEISVYLNERQDFAFLYPQPRFDYAHYQPRVKRLKLTGYRKRNQVIERRFDKISSYFSGPLQVLEIGSFDGAFLRLAKERNVSLDLMSLETDADTKPDRDQLRWLKQYSDFDELVEEGLHFDIVCFFHILEHIADPAVFLNSCSKVLAPEGKIIVEVPSQDDPLLKLYHSKAYEDFYFQAQHPYVYSADSLCRLLEANRYRIERCMPHQRYGLENHLTWLAEHRPGGNETLRTMFSPIDAQYRKRLEAAGLADAVIVVAERAIS